MAVTNKYLKVISVNVNSIVTNQKRHSLLQFLNKHQPDMALLNETKLNNNHRLSFKDYSMVRDDRPNSTQGGGTCILIKRNIKFDILQISPHQVHRSIETSAIKLKCSNNLNLIVISIYAPGHNNVTITNELDHLLNQIDTSNLNNYFIITGDINARLPDWGDSTMNSRGGYIRTWIANHCVEHHFTTYTPAEPTFPKSGSYLDICFADSRLELFNLVNDKLKTLDYDSDHKAIWFEVNLSISNLLIDDEHNQNFSKNYKKTNWNKFRKYLLESDIDPIPNNRNLSNNEIDEYLDKLNKVINNSIEATVPEFKPSNSTEKYANKKTNSLHKMKSNLTTRLNKLKNNYNQNQPDIQSAIEEVQAQIEHTKYELAKEFSKSCNKYWSNKAKKIDYKNSDTFFPEVNSMFRHKESIPIKEIKVATDNQEAVNKLNIDINSTTINNDCFILKEQESILNALGLHFEKINARKEKYPDNRLHNIIEKEVNQFEQHLSDWKRNVSHISEFSENNPASNPERLYKQEIPTFFTVFEVFSVIKSIKNKVSFGLDGIPNIVIKNLPIQTIIYITIIFNNIINNNYYPVGWKVAKVIPIVKKDKDPTLATSMRPISMLPNLSKIFEALINQSITTFCDKNKIIPKQQFGFRHQHSTTHAINKLLTDATHHLNEHKLIAAALIDLEKAFDSVWLKGLFYKLIKKGFPIHIIRLLWEMFQNRTFTVHHNKEKSTITFKVEDGLQQGTVNAPIIFNIYNSDTLNLFELNQDNNTYSIAFADDLIVYVADKYPDTAKTKLEEIVNKINKYYLNWNLKINANKCETILIRLTLDKLSRAKKKNWRSFHINIYDNSNNKTEIPHKNSVKYLGVMIDSLLRMTIHPDTQLVKARKAFLANSKLFYNKYLSKKAKVICYSLLVRPILTYAIPIWFNQSAYTMERFRVFERSCLRSCLKKYRSASSNFQRMISNKEIYDEANIPRIDNFMIKLCRDYFANNKEIKGNDIITNLCTVNENYIEKGKKSGYLPPQAFMQLDKQGLIQNQNNVPIIYHWQRHKKNKKIPINAKEIPTLKYSQDIPSRDFNDFHRLSEKYWWLHEDGCNLEDIRKRARAKKRRKS